MRYHYDKPDHYTSMYGRTYICDHPVYSHCTLYKIGEKGLAVIQQRYIPETKSTYWTEIDPWLVDALYLHEGFKDDTQKKLAKAPGNTRCDGDGIYSIRNGESHAKSTVTYPGSRISKR